MLFLLLNLANAYEPVSGIEFPNRTEVKQYNFYHNIDLRVQINRMMNTQFYDLLIYRAILDSSLASWKKIEPLGIIDNKCRPLDLIEIYEISEAQLNNPQRFPANFIGNPATGKPNLWGFYDPRNSEFGLDTIVVSPHGDDSINFGLIVHEIAHFWYADFCLDEHMKMTSEQFAVMIEREIKW